MGRLQCLACSFGQNQKENIADMYYDYDNDKNKIQNQSFSPLHLRLSDCMCFYCILRALLYSLERSFKHRGLTSGGVFGQASYEAKNLLCKYINCGSQVVFVTKKHLPPLPAHLDGCFFWQKKIIIVQKTQTTKVFHL